MSPLDLARQRTEAIEALQAALAGHLEEAQRLLYEGLLARLEDIQADPTIIPQLLAEFQQAAGLPLAIYYAQSLLKLPALAETYFEGLGVAGFTKLRAPLTDYITQRLGITAAGEPVAGGYLASILGDTSAQQALLRYAYSAQASGIGLAEYKSGLRQLALGVGNGQGLMQQLYGQAYDDMNRLDRVLQGMAAEHLGLGAYLYQGGLIQSSRAFCKVRNGKCFTAAEVAAFGTSRDKFGGYTDKAQGLFAGKSEPYSPLEDAGGYNCRHGLHAVPNNVALSLRPDLMENDRGQLVPRP